MQNCFRALFFYSFWFCTRENRLLDCFFLLFSFNPRNLSFFHFYSFINFLFQQRSRAQSQDNYSFPLYQCSVLLTFYKHCVFFFLFFNHNALILLKIKCKSFNQVPRFHLLCIVFFFSFFLNSVIFHFNIFLIFKNRSYKRFKKFQLINIFLMEILSDSLFLFRLNFFCHFFFFKF